MKPSPTNLSDELKTILDNFARWTIQNVEHGIYIPLPSPETEAAITAAYAEAIMQAKPGKQNKHMANSSWGEGYDIGVEDFIESLIFEGLLPNNASDGTKEKE